MATLNPYLSFRRDARAALEFYQSALGGTVEAMPFSAMAEQFPVADEDKDLIMHGQLLLEDGLVIMAADTPSTMESDYVVPNSGIQVALTGGPDDFERISAAFPKLSEGGQVNMPLAQAPWGDHFGQFTDKFGISWMINVSGR